MRSLRFRARQFVVLALYGLGVLHIWKHLALRSRAVVLTYHRVLPQESLDKTWSHRGIVVSRETFDQQMRTLRQRFRPLTAAEFEAGLDRGGQFEPGSCLVTFDDGWIDTYREALPILRRHGIPAIVFLPARYIGSGEMFWQERLSGLLFAIWRRARGDGDFARQVGPTLAATGLTGVLTLPEGDVREHIAAIVRRKKADRLPDPAALVRDLSALVEGGPDVTEDVDGFMTWENVREMRRHSVTFGGHGDTHRLLTTLPADELQREVDASWRAIESATGEQPRCFAYPNGDWNDAVAAAVGRGRFALAFSTQPGHAGRSTNRLAVRRVNIHEDMTDSVPMFLARLVGAI